MVVLILLKGNVCESITSVCIYLKQFKLTTTLIVLEDKAAGWIGVSGDLIGVRKGGI